MVGLNCDGTRKKYATMSLTGCTSSISPEEEIESLKETIDLIIVELLETSWWQIIKRNTLIKRINCLTDRIKEIKNNLNN